MEKNVPTHQPVSIEYFDRVEGLPITRCSVIINFLRYPLPVTNPTKCHVSYNAVELIKINKSINKCSSSLLSVVVYHQKQSNTIIIHGLSDKCCFWPLVIVTFLDMFDRQVLLRLLRSLEPSPMVSSMVSVILVIEDVLGSSIIVLPSAIPPRESRRQNWKKGTDTGRCPIRIYKNDGIPTDP